MIGSLKILSTILDFIWFDFRKTLNLTNQIIDDDIMNQWKALWSEIWGPSLRLLIPEQLSLLYGRRRENVFRDIKCRTISFANSFFPDSVKNWNNIGVEFRQIDSLSKFKKEIRCLLVPKKKSVFCLFHPHGIKKIVST